MRPLAAVVACLLFVSSAAFAQGVGSSGEIRGTVTDPSGAVLPNSNVTVVNAQTSFDSRGCLRRSTTLPSRGQVLRRSFEKDCRSASGRSSLRTSS